MLTRLRIQGFKNLLDVDVRFGPFTCVAGKNAVGKSNLFDAIRFLQILTENPLMEAVAKLRETKGRVPQPGSLFTRFEEFTAPVMRFTADMIVIRDVEDDFGVTSRAATSSLRYTLALRVAEGESTPRLVIDEERLDPIPIKEMIRSLPFPHKREFRHSAVNGRRTVPFISTARNAGESGARLTIHQEGHGGRKQTVPGDKASRTVVGGTTTSEFPTILAAHREMNSWGTLLLEPSSMRAPSLYVDPQRIDNKGGNLPATLLRLARHEKRPGSAWADIANRAAELVEDIRAVRVLDDARTESVTLEVKGRDGVFHPARSVSDGTLRFLVLATMDLDPEVNGVLCLEEPENGIHPDRIRAMVNLLTDIAVDPTLPIGQDNPLRQVVINTHSPLVVQCVKPSDLIYFELQTVFQGESSGQIAIPRFPRNTWRAKNGSSAEPLARGRLRSYLSSPIEERQLWFEFDRK